MEQPRFLTGLAFRLVDDFLEPFLPEEDSPQFQPLQLLRVQSLGRDYGEQQELLAALHEKTGEDLFVASYSALQNKETGRLHTYCVWSEDVDSLLPETDRIFFVKAGDGGKAEMACGADWDKARAVVGYLMEAQDTYPERYLVREFPSAEQLAEMESE
jgi:hypothetical protein